MLNWSCLIATSTVFFPRLSQSNTRLTRPTTELPKPRRQGNLRHSRVSWQVGYQGPDSALSISLQLLPTRDTSKALQAWKRVSGCTPFWNEQKPREKWPKSLHQHTRFKAWGWALGERQEGKEERKWRQLGSNPVHSLEWHQQMAWVESRLPTQPSYIEQITSLLCLHSPICEVDMITHAMFLNSGRCRIIPQTKWGARGSSSTVIPVPFSPPRIPPQFPCRWAMRGPTVSLLHQNLCSGKR